MALCTGRGSNSTFARSARTTTALSQLSGVYPAVYIKPSIIQASSSKPAALEALAYFEKEKMRNYFLALLLTFSLAACSSDDAPPGVPAEPPAPEAPTSP